jgi:hypothetical protein
VPYLQANFMLGLDTDAGEEPVELTKEFMSRTPFVWPVVNIPHPFGGTPLYERYRVEGRILTPMPFAFYYSPHLVTTLRNYTPAEFYGRLIELFSHFTSSAMLRRRLASTRSGGAGTMHVVRTLVKRKRIEAFRRLRHLLVEDPQFRAFHEGRSGTLPEYYHRMYERLLGPYASLMPREERAPLFESEPAAASSRPAAPPAVVRADAPAVPRPGAAGAG